jgi:hypothetical protein
MARKPKKPRKKMPPPSKRHADLRLKPKRFKNWSAFADYLFLELKRTGRYD